MLINSEVQSAGIISRAENKLPVNNGVINYNWLDVLLS